MYLFVRRKDERWFAMQQMNSQQGKQQNSYGQYEGMLPNDAYTESYGTGQKLDNEDEQFADILVRRMKQELGEEQLGSAKRTLNARMIVAIVSLCALVLAFALLTFALVVGHLPAEGVYALSGGIFWLGAVIISINGYFNWASSTISKHENDKRTK